MCFLGLVALVFIGCFMYLLIDQIDYESEEFRKNQLANEKDDPRIKHNRK